MRTNSVLASCHSYFECHVEGQVSYPIDLKRMRYVVEVARAEAITSAGDTLGITQSALSRSIAEVEDTLGVKLFHRRPRGIELSEQGAQFVAQAERILANVDDLVNDMRASGDEVTGRIRLGVSPASNLVYAQRAIRKLATEYPQVIIEVVTGSPQILCPRLLAGDLQLVIGSSSYLKRWNDLEVTSLKELFFACILRKDHPLKDNTHIAEVDVLAHPVILPENFDPVHSDTAKRYYMHDLGTPQPRYITDDLNLVYQLVASTDAWFPMMHPSPTFDNLDEHFWLLRDVVDMPTHYLSIARSTLHRANPLTERMQNLIASQFSQTGLN